MIEKSYHFILMMILSLLVFGGMSASQNAFAESVLQDMSVILEDHPMTDGAIMMDHSLESEAHDAHEEVKGLPQLDFSTYSRQMFWMAIIFFALYFIFAKKSLPAISSSIENRKNHIDSDLDQAEKIAAEANQVQETYLSNIQHSHDNAARQIQEMEQAMKSKAEQSAAAFKKRSEQEIQFAEERITEAKNKVMREMNDIVIAITAEAVEKITGIAANRKLVETVIAEKDGSVKTKSKAA